MITILLQPCVAKFVTILLQQVCIIFIPLSCNMPDIYVKLVAKLLTASFKFVDNLGKQCEENLLTAYRALEFFTCVQGF